MTVLPIGDEQTTLPCDIPQGDMNKCLFTPIGHSLWTLNTDSTLVLVQCSSMFTGVAGIQVDVRR